MNTNTNEIIEIFKSTIRLYDESCRQFFGAPSKEAINRKTKLIVLLSNIQNELPADVIWQLYLFYQKNYEENSRLITNMKDAFFKLFDITDRKIDHCRCDPCPGCIEKSRTMRLFHSKISNIQKVQGYEEYLQVRSTLRYLAIGKRNIHSPISSLPNELLIYIGSFISNKFSYQQVQEIAKQNFIV